MIATKPIHWRRKKNKHKKEERKLNKKIIIILFSHYYFKSKVFKINKYIFRIFLNLNIKEG